MTAQTTRGAPISVRGLEIEYQTGSGPVHALGPIDLDIQAGEFVSVVGPSGCGKSTLLKAAAGLIAPTRGEIDIAGRRVQGPQSELGIVFQNPLLMDWRTVMSNIMLQAEMRRMPREQAQAKARALLKQVGLEAFEDHRPHELSGGMQQRVGICRALLHEPPLIMMDEPFGALDALTREQMCYDLQDLWMDRRPTVLFITHSISEATLLSDRVIVMSSRPGRIIEEFRLERPRPRLLDDESHEVDEVSREIRRLLGVQDHRKESAA
ncbi:ABC transporter ATP-binding protein [Homoserinibacter sp. YIM 151385]|uniref:ABC transporter ATP-binding protein n=1 Tax=Homoserinibacter sp. YIM 151385 TaxID=2985506 RepID=UPI0022F12A90|nr:ABC transporter ATP-binding protein [Homoserinibacter sp. YIM 151385]WBU37899.1 ABC transporter ATP-binding protein [Homoserinibacter sp. YIM 151385]